MNYAIIAASIKKTIIGRKTKSTIAAFLLAASTAFAQVPSYVPTNGLVGWWPFNGNANDESGNGNNGVVNGTTLNTDRFNTSNSCYKFNGNNYIDFPSLNFPGDFSISLWFMADSLYQLPCGQHAILSKFKNTQPGFGYELGINELGGVQVGNWSIGTPYASYYTTKTWLNAIFCYSFSQSTMSLYINGVFSSSRNSLIINNSSTLIRAGSRTNSTPYCGFIGSIDDIGIWNRALSQQEITALYNAQSCVGNITADGPTTFCAGNSVNLKSDVVGGTYQWKKNGVNITTNGTSRTYKATATGSYTCVATCNGTALTSNAIAVTSKTNAFASVTATGATSFCAGDSVTLNCTNLGSNYSVQWYRTNVSIENATAYSQVVKQPGTYKVVTKNLTNGCSRISGSSAVVAVSCRLANPDVIAADITESDFDAATREAEPKGKIYIYPNPTSDNKFTVELMGLEVDGNATLEVYNAMGQLLSSEKVNITNGSLNRTIQIDEQSKGQLCLVRLMAGSEVYDSKVILK